MVCDEHTYDVAGKTVEALLPGIGKVILDPENLHANEHGVGLCEEGLKAAGQVDLMIAVGSGTIHDITRYHAYNKNIDFISVPTAASVDGFVSTVAAMTWNGCKVSITACSPVVVVADTDIFKTAPLRLTASGVSDLLGKYTALADWKIAHILTGEYICEEICEMEYQALSSLKKSLDGLTTGDTEAYEALSKEVKRTALSLIRLKTPVHFGKPGYDPVVWVCCLSAVDKNAHLKAMFQVINMFHNPEFRRKADVVNNVDELYALIEKYEYK